MTNKIAKFFRSVYEKLFKIDDTPQRIALGFGLGAFLGIFPGTGPLAALFLSAILHINRAAALAGSLLTNTWSSFIVLILAFKLGSLTIGAEWQDIAKGWSALQNDFHWHKLFDLSVLRVALPVLLGYIIIGFIFGLLVYLITLLVLKTARKEK